MAVDHNCGFVVAHTLHDVYYFLDALQHRGRDAVGIFAMGKDRIDVIKWRGKVKNFGVGGLHDNLPSSDYHIYGGHVRYGTKGRKGKVLQEAHPHVIGGTIIDNGNYILISDCEAAIIHNGQVNKEYYTGIEQKLLTTDCDSEAILHLINDIGPQEFLRQVPGAYSMAVAYKGQHEIMVLRDRFGLKPAVLGKRGGKKCVVSEDIALRDNNAEIIEELDLGSVYYISPEGKHRIENVIAATTKHCFFEWNYISNADTILDRVSVRSVRQTLGEMLAEEFHPNDIDVVTFLPSCPKPAARSYAKKLSLDFRIVFSKMKGDRSFQGPDAEERENSINKNLYLTSKIDNTPTKEYLKGKTVLIIDDSIVRGNNSGRAINLVRNAGANKIYFASYTPPIGLIGEDGIQRCCRKGVDMPPDDNFIARAIPKNGSPYNRTLEEISEIMTVPTTYLSIGGMLRGFERVGIPREKLCTFCIGGQNIY